MHSTFTIQDEFPPVGYDEWRALAEADLKGPLRTEARHPHLRRHRHPAGLHAPRPAGGDDPCGFPGLPPFVRGSRRSGPCEPAGISARSTPTPTWPPRTGPSSTTCQGGATSLLLRLDLAARNGLDPDDPRGSRTGRPRRLMAYSVDDLDAALAGRPSAHDRRDTGGRGGVPAGRGDAGRTVAAAEDLARAGTRGLQRRSTGACWPARGHLPCAPATAPWR